MYTTPGVSPGPGLNELSHGLKNILMPDLPGFRLILTSIVSFCCHRDWALNITCCYSLFRALCIEMPFNATKNSETHKNNKDGGQYTVTRLHLICQTHRMAPYTTTSNVAKGVQWRQVAPARTS